MNATFETTGDMASPPNQSPHCRVAVFYEDTAARERAVQLSHRLMEQFWADLEFEFSWWRFRYLASSEVTEAAALEAAHADVLVFAVNSEGPVPPEVIDWVHQWLPLRGQSSGVLVPMLRDLDREEAGPSQWMDALTELAERAGLELLLPANLGQSRVLRGPVSHLEQRAKEMTGVMDDILRQANRPPPPPSHWGLNE